MIGIVIPLKAKRLSDDWILTERLLQQTLRSISGQTYKSVQVVVACHDPPDLGDPSVNPQVELLRVSIAQPSGRNVAEMFRDKEAKLAAGTRSLLAQECEWILKLDADDLIARNTCEFIAKSTRDAVIFRHGIVSLPGSKWHWNERKNFHRICGSCFAIQRTAILDAKGLEILPIFNMFVSSAHEKLDELCKQYLISVSYPPFAAACYVSSSDGRFSEVVQPHRRLSFRELIGRVRRLRRTTRSVQLQFSMGCRDEAPFSQPVSRGS